MELPRGTSMNTGASFVGLNRSSSLLTIPTAISDDLATTDIERHVVVGDQSAEALGDVLDFEKCAHGATS